MKTHLNLRRFVLLTAVVMLGYIIASITWATSEPEKLSPAEVISRLLGLEERVTAVEKRLEAL